MTTRRWFFGSLLLIVIAWGASVACGGDDSHVFQGRAYIDGRDCLGTNSSVDVVSGDDTGFCDARCLAQPEADGGRQLYASSECPPDPFPYDASGSDPNCGRALAAFFRDDTCNVDGLTSTNPVEAGPDTGAADASSGDQ